MKNIILAQADADASAITEKAISGTTGAVSSGFGKTLDFLNSFTQLPGVKTVAELLGPFGKYIGAIIVFLLAWFFICPFIGWIVSRALKKTTADDKIAKWAGHETGAAEKGIGSLVKYIALLFFTIIALNIAKLEQITEPLLNLLNKFVEFIPGLVGAAIILFVAIFVFKIVKNIVFGLLSGVKLDQRLGSPEDKHPISSAISSALFWFLVLLVLPQALAFLKLGTIADPILGIVSTITKSIPSMLLAAVLLIIGFLIGSIARKLVTNLLVAVGADHWAEKIGITAPSEGRKSVSSIVGYVVMISTIVFAASAAIGVLNIDLFKKASEGFVSGYFRILLALIILGAGILLSRFAYNAIAESNLVLAKVARYAILVVTIIAALERSNIVNPELIAGPFQALITAVAVALGIGGAIAIGLGGKDQVHNWIEKRCKK